MIAVLVFFTIILGRELISVTRERDCLLWERDEGEVLTGILDNLWRN